MTVRFLLSLLSSWAVNPLGILLVQAYGLAHDSTLLLLLLGTGACVPFQLLMNECLAAGNARQSFQPSWVQLGMVLLAQSVSCLVTLMLLPYSKFPLSLVLVLALLLVVSTGLSYKISVLYFKLALHGLLSRKQAIIIGMLPGVVSLILFTAYIFASQKWFEYMSAICLSIALVPAIVQYIYMSRLSSSFVQMQIQVTVSGSVMPSIHIFLALAVLMALTVIGTSCRDTIAGYSISYTALVVVGLNSTFSLCNTFTRITFFSSSKKLLKFNLPIFSVIIAVAAAIAYTFTHLLAFLLALAASQLGMIAVIEAARKSSTFNVSQK